ncbi:MAG: hypothetical protein GY868_00110, partial [Deltaproteobacteria bacterium]|nr:hypothetical protein [Deltaproteobacteria bacterium]
MQDDTTIESTAAAVLVQAGIAASRELLSVDLLAGGGSDRCFHRICVPGASYVLMVATGRRAETGASVEIGTFLRRLGIAVPAVVWDDPERQLVLWEDVGDMSLYVFCRQAASRTQIMDGYR